MDLIVPDWGTIFKKNSVVEVFDYKTNNWYQLFLNKKSLGYLSEDCVSIKNAELILVNDCVLYNSIKDNQVPDAKIIKKGTRYKYFSFHSKINTKIKYKKKEYWFPLDFFKFIHDDIDEAFYEKVSIDHVLKIKKENVLLSQAIDKTMYVSTELGVFASFGGKDWYRLKNLEERKYEIGLTYRGYLLADNLISKNYGKSFSEFFPSYAFPYEDAFVKKIMVSPQGKYSIYLTFSSYSNLNSITLFILNSIEEGWKQIYPTMGEKILIIPIEDTTTSILKFVHKWINTSKHPYKGKIELEDISIQGEKHTRTATLLLKITNKKEVKRFYTSLKMSFKNKRSWIIEDEQWRFL